MIIFGLGNTVLSLTDVMFALVVCIAGGLVGAVIYPAWVKKNGLSHLVVSGILIIACFGLFNIVAAIREVFGISSIIMGIMVGLLFVIGLWIGITITKKRRKK